MEYDLAVHDYGLWEYSGIPRKEKKSAPPTHVDQKVEKDEYRGHYCQVCGNALGWRKIFPKKDTGIIFMRYPPKEG
jgi:hypothetical protein